MIFIFSRIQDLVNSLPVQIKSITISLFFLCTDKRAELLISFSDLFICGNVNQKYYISLEHFYEQLFFFNFQNSVMRKMFGISMYCTTHCVQINKKQPNPPIPVAARLRREVCCRSLFGIAGSNPAGGMDVCLL